MARVPLIGGAYTAQSIIANAQRCVNLYPERNPEDAPVPFTYYPTPGLRELTTVAGAGGWRALYLATNGRLYGVVGPKVVQIASSGRCTEVGEIPSLPTPVSMADDGETIVIVDGTKRGYTLDLATQAFAQLDDPTGSFEGSALVEYVNTYFVFVEPTTGKIYSTLSNGIDFDPLWFAFKSGYADPAQVPLVLKRTVFLLGTQKTEIWVNIDAGAQLPFQPQPGTYIEHGVASAYSVAKIGEMGFWLSQDPQGQGIVLQAQNYEVTRISTHAIENAISRYPSIADARGMTYQFRGHMFYVLTFPSGNATWVYDVASGFWHQWMWQDADGGENRCRASAIAAAYGKIFAGDHTTGQLYELDFNSYTDNGSPIRRIRSFPHMVPTGGRINYTAFLADMEVGAEVPGGGTASVFLRWSDTRGLTWGFPVEQLLTVTGAGYVAPLWRRLGYARDRVFELSWDAPIRTALNGAWVDSPDLEEPRRT